MNSYNVTQNIQSVKKKIHPRLVVIVNFIMQTRSQFWVKMISKLMIMKIKENKLFKQKLLTNPLKWLSII